MNMLKVDGLSLRFGDHRVLDNISFSFKKGKITGLLGPNGAGKSSIMKILAGLVRADSGELHCENIPGTGFSDIRNFSAFMIDDPSFYSFLSGRQNLEIVARLLNSSRDPQEQMRILGMDPNSGKKVKHFSTGMKQRLSIAQVLMHEVDLYIMDEPFNGLDPKGFQEVVALIKELKAQGKTLVISSHLLKELEDLADDFLLLDQGRIALSISKEDLSRTRNRVRVTFNDPVGEEALRLLKEFGRTSEDSRSAQLALDKSELEDLIRKLVKIGALPSRITSQNLLEKKYLEIVE